MKRTKRVLSLIICMLLAITSLPVTQLVFAAEINDELVVLHETTFENVSDLDWVLNANALPYITPTVDDDGYYTFEHTVTSGTSNKVGYINRSLDKLVISKDDNNRTEVTADNIDGKYIIEFELDVLIKQYSGAKEPYYGFGFTSGDTEILSVRFESTSFSIINNPAKAANSTYKRSSDKAKTVDWGYDAANEVENLKFKITYDTVNKTISTYVNGNLMTEYDGALQSEDEVVSCDNAAAIDGLRITTLSRADVGTFLKFKEFKITQVERAENATLSALPKKLNVNDVNAVTNAEITLPEIEGVVWTSSDSEVVSINGTKATVNRVKGVDKEVTVKATFNADGVNYSKKYNMTVAAVKNIINYYGKDETLLDTTEVKDGQKAPEITAPSIEHYDFLGWYEKNAETAFDFNTAISNHVNLYAKYEPKSYNVVFKADGVTIATLTGKYNDTVTGEIPEIPSKANHTAIGWYIGNTDEQFGVNTIITGPDMVINAKYEEGIIVTHTVKFVVDGTEYDTKTVMSGYTVNLPENPTKTNYIFKYWKLNGAEFKENTPVTGDIILVAEFSPNPVKVNFYLDDTMTKLYIEGVGYYNVAYGELPTNPVKDKYKFVGWKMADGVDFTSETVVTKEISVYAEWENTTKIIFDEDITKYTSPTGNNVEFKKVETLFTQSRFDNGFVTEVVNSDFSDRTLTDVLFAKVKVPIGEYNEKTRTQTYLSKFAGDYEFEIVFDTKITGKYTAENDSAVKAPFGLISTGAFSNDVFTPILSNRMLSTNIQSYNSESSTSNTFNNLSENKTGQTTIYEYPTVKNGVAEDVSLKIRYDTVEGKAYMTVNDSPDYSWGTPSSKPAYIDGFYISMMPCYRNGNFVKIKRVRVIQHNDYSDSTDYQKVQELLNDLPDTLVNNPLDATGKINFTQTKGITWSSTDESVISTETGEILPWYNDVEVDVTATVTSGMFSYEKTYTLTVKADKNVINDEFLNEKFTSESDLANWSFVNLDDIAIAGYNVDENGLKIKKSTPAFDTNTGIETKSYFAFYDLYKTVGSDEYSITEVKDHKGVYDVTIDYSKYSDSKLPMNIAIGYRNDNVFYDYGMLVLNKESTILSYQATAEKVATVPLNIGNSAKLTFRIDNNRKEICLFVDGVMITNRLNYSTTFGDDAVINSVKIEIDKNNNIDDYIIIKGISATTVIENAFPEIEDVLSVASNIDVYDITSVPASVSEINKLPTDIGGYTVKWSSSSNQINLETGEVFHDSTPKTVYLYAEIYDEDAKYPYVVKKTFKLNIRAAEPGSSEIDQFKVNSLGKITNQNYDDIRYDLNLPQVDGVVWTSSDTSIIGNDGILNREKLLTTDTPVVITATSNKASKTYKLIVSKRTSLDVIASSENDVVINIGSIANAKLSGDVITTFNYVKGGEGKVNIVDEKGNAVISLVVDSDGFYFDFNGSDYKKFNLEAAKIDIITMPDINKVAIFVDGMIAYDYVDSKSTSGYVAGVVSDINVGTIKMSMDKYGILQSNIDNLDYFKDAEIGYANKNGINLPYAALTNATVTWNSSDESLLTNKGVVTTPATMKIVNLTFEIADKEDGNVFISKNFEIAVDCNDDKNIIFNNVPVVDFNDITYPPSNATDGKTTSIFKAIDVNDVDFEMVFNLGEYKLFNTVYILQASKNMEGYKIYASNDGEQWSIVSSGDMSGKSYGLMKFTETKASYIKFVVEKCNAAEVDIREIKFYFSGTAIELAEYDISILNVDAAPVGTKINLPTIGANGTPFTWISSNESVIDSKGNITRPTQAVTVNLTVKATVEGKEITKTFEVYVDTKTTSGPTQVGGGAGGGGGGGVSSNNVDKTPIIGATDEDVYAQDTPSDTPVSTGSYKDVKETDWYSEAVKILTEKGIVSGDGTGNFYPTNNVTREQFVKMILEAIDVGVENGTHAFDDVVSGAWYEAYIATAVSKGIVNGVGSGNFGIGTNISRQDMAVLIERVLDYKEIEIEKADVEPFADASSVADYAANAVANMKAIGLIQGYNNNYNPKDNLTRAEAATVIASLLNLLSK